MSKLHFWMGTFDSADDFNAYMDQSGYFQTFQQQDESDPELACEFCREIGVSSYDEDFMFMHFEHSGNYDFLLSRVPANLNKFIPACVEKGIAYANVFICYPAKELGGAHPENSRKVTYIGTFNETSTTTLVEDEKSRMGFTDAVWVGSINKAREEFLQYFDQHEYMEQLNLYKEGKAKKKPAEKHSCDFCRDVNMAYNVPEYTTIYFEDEPADAETIVKKAIKNAELADRVLFTISRSDLKKKKLNAVVHIVQHDMMKAKEEPKLKIFPQEVLKMYPLPKGFVPERDNYNGLKFLGNYAW